jgi:regulator of chromosome condensation
MLTAAGELWTLGNSEQGQLGRVGEKFSHRGGRRGGGLLLRPGLLHHRSRAAVTDIWAGSYNTVACTADGSVMVVGLNNYSQVGVGASELVIFMPEARPSFSGCSGVSVGQHHALLLRPDGRVAALGRAEYGRLGLGEAGGDAASPSTLAGLPACRAVACGTAVSYAVTTEGQLFSWGMGTNGQLGTGEEEDLWQPTLMKSRQLEGRRVLAVSAGGQHTLVLARDS